jgi:hypothetical protein
MCQYCNAKNNDFILLNQDTAMYSGLNISINRQGMLRVRSNDYDPDGFQSQEIVNIKFCPICGKKLGGK